MKVSVIGSGAWGTALALVLHKNGHEVTLWSFLETETQALIQKRENPFLAGVKIPEGIAFTNDLACAAVSDLVVFATPSFAVRKTAENTAPFLQEGVLLVSVTKGIESGTFMRMSEIISSITKKDVVVLSGPSHAEEVSRGIPTGCVAASTCREKAELVQSVFMNDRFRIYTSDDPIGAELGAAMKNVIALCAGISDGMGYGDNTKALLMTRGLTETARLGIALGSKKSTFTGLTGVGDLIVTCTSMHSRNRRAGILIGQGKTPQEAMKEVGAVVEGYYAAESVMGLAKKVGADMPITQEAYRVLYEGKDPVVALDELMQRKKCHETEDSSWE